MDLRGIPTNTNLRSFRERPQLVSGKVAQNSKPTAVERGVFSGYSLPIWNSDNEELFFRCNVPRRWDGATNPTCTVIGYLDTAETDGDDFQLQLGWFNEVCDNSANALADTVNLVASNNIDCPSPRNAQYTVFSHTFTIDLDVADPHLVAGDLLGLRLRRIAVAGGGVEIAGEFVVVDIYISWPINQAYTIHS